MTADEQLAKVRLLALTVPRLPACICTLSPMRARLRGCDVHGFAVPIGDVHVMLRCAAKAGEISAALKRLAGERPQTWRDEVAVAARTLAPWLRKEVEEGMARS